MTVALIERNHFGGTCVNTGCIPTKTLVASAKVAQQVRRAAEYGVSVGGATSIDMHAVKARKDAIVMASRSGLETWLRSMERCTVLQGHARFRSAHEIEVGDAVLSAKHIFINVGGRPSVPAMPGIDRVSYLTSTSILELDALPQHLVIIGGSYVGLEFAQIFRRFGSRVTIVEKGMNLVSREDQDVSDAIRGIMEGEGIDVRTQAECISFEQRPHCIGVNLDCSIGEPEVVASHVLLAVGRRPNTDDLGLQHAGVNCNEHGFIVVNDALETGVPGVWALGECNGHGAFTHVAYNDFEIVAANLLDGEARRVTDRILCYGLFIDPPLGRAGLSEREARLGGFDVRVGTRPMTRVSRAVEKGETQGFMKIVVDAKTDRILGAAILGVEGDEAVHGILDVMSANASATTLRRTMHIHPTVSELIPTVLGELH